MPFKEDTPSPPRSQALNDLPPAMNSPHRRLQSPSRSPTKGSGQAASAEFTAVVPALDGTDSHPDQENRLTNEVPDDASLSAPPAQRSADMDKAVSDLLTRQRSTLSTNTAASARNPRKHRKLGRAESGSANGLTSWRPAGLEVADSVDTVSSLSDMESTARAKQAPPPMPSQQLSYEAVGAAELRRMLSKKTGTLFEEDESGTRVGGIGQLRDAEVGRSVGVGKRVGARHRDANLS